VSVSNLIIPSDQTITSVSRRKNIVEACGRIGYAVSVFLLGISANAAPSDSSYRELLNSRDWATLEKVTRERSQIFNLDLALIIQRATALVHLGRRAEALALLNDLEKNVNQQIGLEVRSKRDNLASVFLKESALQLYQEGLEYLYEKKYTKAATRFQESLSEDPDQYLSLIRLAQTLFYQKNFDESIRTFNRAGVFKPENENIKKWIARATFEKGELKEALRAFSKIYQEKKIKSQSLVIWYSDALSKTGLRAHAISLLKKEVDENPYYVEGILKLAKFELDSSAGNSAKSVMSIKKNLQVALSRIDYVLKNKIINESDQTDAFLYDLPSIKVQVEKLIEVMDLKLSNLSRKRALEPTGEREESGI